MMNIQLKIWLTNLGLDRYFEMLHANDVDLRSLPHLTDEDLRELGLSLGHRRILLAASANIEADTIPVAQQNDNTSAPGADPERRHLTVLFCDLVGSTKLSNELDPEELRDVLQLYQNLVSAAVRSCDGYVARFLGDGIVAYFGWPQAYEDQAERAVRASLSVMSAIQKSNDEIEQRLEARIGIATGHVVVGDLVGAAVVDTEAVVGETPNRASRLQDVGGPGDIVIGQRTRSLIGQAFELEALGSQSLKGFAQPIYAWRVMRESGVKSRFEAAHGDQLTEQVGREHELGLILERWKLAKQGDGQVLLLSGEAGIGKSRIVQEFRENQSGQDYEQVHLQCLPSRTNSAFFPVVRYLRQGANLYDEDESAIKLDKLERFLAEGSYATETAVPVFASLLSLEGDGRSGDWQRSPQALRGDVIEKFIRLVVDKCRDRPVLCVVEDVHWIDASMRELVGELIAHVIDRPLFVVITYRPEFETTWPDYAHISTMMLNRLPREQAAKIVESVAGPELMATLVEQIVQRSDGVPLYVEELTKSVLERASKGDGKALDQLIPTTLHSSLVARIDQLGSAKETAQIGAVIGRDFTIEALIEIVDKNEALVRSDIEALLASGLVIRRGRRYESIFSFKHALVHDAAYSTILRTRRKEIHSRIIDILERQLGEKSLERVDTLAHHAYQGGIWDKAFDYLSHSGTRAMGRSALQEAAAQFEQALEAAQHLQDTPELWRRIIGIKFELRNALWALGRFEDIIVHLNEASYIAEELNDAIAGGWISVFKSASYWQLGRAEAAIEASDQALTVGTNSRDVSLEVAAQFYLGCAHITSAKYIKAEAHFRSISDRLTGNMLTENCGLPFAPAVIARSWLAWSLAERGEFDQAQSVGNAALNIANDIGHPFNLAHIYYDLGYVYELQGKLDAATSALEQAYGYVQDWNLIYLSPFILGFLGHVYAVTGRPDEGLAHLERAQAAYDRIGLGLFRSLVGVQRGEAFLLAGDPIEARAVTELATTLANDRNEQGHRAYGLRVLGDIAANTALFDPVVAQEHYREALGIARSNGMKPLEVQCHIRLGVLYNCLDEQGNAATHLSEADALAGSINMQLWPHLREQS